MSMKILVVDDDEVLRNELAELLIREGYDVQAADSGSSALNMVKKKDYKLILTDLKMPGMNGIDVLKDVKKLRPNIHMVMITAYGTIDSAVEAMKIGADDYIRKPFEMDQLRSIIENISHSLEFQKKIGFTERTMNLGATSPFKFFKSLINGRNGLCISPKDPKVLKNKYDLHDVSMLWLTDKDSEESCISPKNIFDLKLNISSYFNEHPDGIVFISGFEVLLDHHPWDTIKKFLMDVMDDHMKVSSRLVISLKPDGIEEDVLNEINSLISNPFIQLVSESLSSPIRRHIIKYLNHHKTSSFTGILNEVKIKDAPKLSFHLKRLTNDRFLIKDNHSYGITRRGEKVAQLLKVMEEEAVSDLQSNVSLIIS